MSDLDVRQLFGEESFVTTAKTGTLTISLATATVNKGRYKYAITLHRVIFSDAVANHIRLVQQLNDATGSQKDMIPRPRTTSEMLTFDLRDIAVKLPSGATMLLVIGKAASQSSDVLVKWQKARSASGSGNPQG